MSKQLTISEKSFMNMDKEGVRAVAFKYLENINQGHTDPVEALIFAKKIQELGKSLEDQVRHIAESDHRLGSHEQLVKFNAKIEQRETGVKYDFSSCEDSEWSALMSEFEDAKTKLKEREKFLKNLTKPIADPETGEIINPPIRTGKLGLVVTLK